VLLIPSTPRGHHLQLVTYRVRFAQRGHRTTGSTHLLEHLMFKGSVNYNRDKGNSLDTLLSRTGDQYAPTSLRPPRIITRTSATTRLGLVVGIESDRMRNLCCASPTAGPR